MKESPSVAGMTTQDTTTAVKIRDNAYGTIPIFSRCLRDGAWWDWPDEAELADFAEKDDRVEQFAEPLENNSEYATLYFVA
jgi:hypothetical protein